MLISSCFCEHRHRFPSSLDSLVVFWSWFVFLCEKRMNTRWRTVSMFQTFRTECVTFWQNQWGEQNVSSVLFLAFQCRCFCGAGCHRKHRLGGFQCCFLFKPSQPQQQWQGAFVSGDYCPGGWDWEWVFHKGNNATHDSTSDVRPKDGVSPFLLCQHDIQSAVPKRDKSQKKGI